MEQYIFYNSKRDSLYTNNIITDTPLYYVDPLDPTKRIKIEIFALTRQDDPGSGFVDTTTVTFSELTPAEMLGVDTAIETMLLPYLSLYQTNVEINLHMGVVNDFVTFNNIVDYKIIAIPGTSCCNLYYSYA